MGSATFVQLQPSFASLLDHTLVLFKWLLLAWLPALLTHCIVVS
jgi:hypothetical protein